MRTPARISSRQEAGGRGGGGRSSHPWLRVRPCLPPPLHAWPLSPRPFKMESPRTMCHSLGSGEGRGWPREGATDALPEGFLAGAVGVRRAWQSHSYLRAASPHRWKEQGQAAARGASEPPRLQRRGRGGVLREGRGLRLVSGRSPSLYTAWRDTGREGLEWRWVRSGGKSHRRGRGSELSASVPGLSPCPSIPESQLQGGPWLTSSLEHGPGRTLGEVPSQPPASFLLQPDAFSTPFHVPRPLREPCPWLTAACL